MKINNKGELKALIKECLIEILSDGIPQLGKTRQVEQRTERFVPREAAPILPPDIPPSMKALFRDTQKRAASEIYKETVAVEKQHAVLGEMADTWESMAFHGPLPDRAMNPEQHKAAPHAAPRNVPSPRQDAHMSHGGFGFDQDDIADDGFDPLAAVIAARRARG